MNVADWVNERKTLIDDGVACSQIRLLGSDDSAWGTWPIELKDLAERIERAISQMSEELPSGRHPVKLVALDSRGLQVAQKQQVVVGTSTAAKNAASDQLNSAKAHAISIRTAEEQLATMSARAVAAEERLLETLSGTYELADSFMCLKQKIMLSEEDAEERRERRQLQRELMEEAKPLVAAVSQVLAAKLGEYMQQQRKDR